MIARAIALGLALTTFVSASAQAHCRRGAVVDWHYHYGTMPTEIYSRSCEPPVRLHCTLEGKPFADLREASDGHYRLRMASERKWSKLHDNAVGLGVAMFWAGGAKCVRR